MATRTVVITVLFMGVLGALTSAQSYTFNRTTELTPTATVAAANFTINDTASLTFKPSSASEDSDDESVDSEGDRSIGSTNDDDSESEDDSDSSLASPGSSGSGFTFGNALNATSTIESTYKNWIGSALGTASDTACYREAHIAKTCPLGFDFKLGTCWAECPFSYPVRQRAWYGWQSS
jgi:hypothetical protein